MNKDLYSILGIERNASDAELKRVYRKLAQKYHPDVNKSKEAEQKFKEINVAYEILSDKKKRAQYDQFGAVGGQGGGPQGGGFGGFDPSNFEGFADIFETFFGGSAHGGARGPKRRGPVPGNSIESVLRLTFEESAFGTEKELELTKSDLCSHCHGKGAEPDSRRVSCAECQGAGQVRTIKQTLLGAMQTVRTCSTCQGEGQIPEKKCKQCHGQMRTRQKSRVTVKIPAGIENGATLKLRGKGEAGTYGGEPGDLYLHIQVAPHPRFQRTGYDVYSREKIHTLQAILGDEISVQTLHGQVSLKIPAGTSYDQTFKIKGYGVPLMRGEGRGDHYIKINVEIPAKLSRKERELYEQLAREAGLK